MREQFQPGNEHDFAEFFQIEFQLSAGVANAVQMNRALGFAKLPPHLVRSEAPRQCMDDSAPPSAKLKPAPAQIVSMHPFADQLVADAEIARGEETVCWPVKWIHSP